MDQPPLVQASLWFRNHLVNDRVRSYFSDESDYTTTNTRPNEVSSDNVWNDIEEDDEDFIDYIEKSYGTLGEPVRSLSLPVNSVNKEEPAGSSNFSDNPASRELPDLNIQEDDEMFMWCDKEKWDKISQYIHGADEEPNSPDKCNGDDKSACGNLNGVKSKFALNTVALGQMEETKKPPERDFTDFEEFKRELEFTLNSKHNGYSNVDELASDFTSDTGVDPLKIALRYGFPTFEAFLKSNMLRSVVRIEPDAKDEMRYLPHVNPSYVHIREAQTASQIGIEQKNEKLERRRLCLMFLPEVQERWLEGRMRLTEVAAEMGAERRYVEHREIRDAYLKKYEVELNKDELRRLFNHPSMKHVFSVVCADEFEVNEEESYDNLIYIKLKQPLEDLRKIHAECKEKLANGQSIIKRQKIPKKPKENGP